MADIEITYNNSTIVSMSDSGTEVLETNGTFLADDITIQYTKSGGGGSTTNITCNTVGSVCCYQDANNTIKQVTIDPMTSVNDYAISGSMAVLFTADTTSTISGATLIHTISLGTRASYRYALVYQVN